MPFSKQQLTSISQVFDYLTVLTNPFKLEGKQRYYVECECKCGKKVICLEKQLPKGSRTSCGCKRKFNSKNPKKLGQKYGCWTVIKEPYKVTKDSIIQRMIDVQCVCGKVKSIQVGTLGKTSKSCGCKAGELIANRISKHRGCKTRLYSIWSGMKQRCYNRNIHSYVNYGGKGIQVCDKWLNFKNFREWALNNGYKDNLTIDRLDSEKNYSPNNCEWVSKSDNGKRVTSSLRYKIRQLKEENEKLRGLLTQNNINFN